MNKPVKVLQVMSTLDRGGAESMIMNLYRAIDPKEVCFDFVTHGSIDGEFTDEIKQRGGKIYCCPRYKGKNHYAYSKWWNDFFKQHREYQILHSHVRSTAAIYIHKAKKYGIKTIAHSHSMSNGKGLTSFAKRLLQYPLRYQADYFFGCSREAAVWLFGKSVVDGDRYHTLNNAVDTSLYTNNLSVREEYREKLGVKAEEILLIHVGRFHEAKNHSFIIKVFSELVKNNTNSRLILVGDGPLREAVEEKSRNEGLADKIIFTGVRDDVPNLLRAADIFIMPSLWEGLPVAAIEAQAAGLPCFLSDRITKEVDVSELVHYLPIDKGYDVWVRAISETEPKRRDVTDDIARAGFDIRSTSEWLQDFYLNLVEE